MLPNRLRPLNASGRRVVQKRLRPVGWRLGSGCLPADGAARALSARWRGSTKRLRPPAVRPLGSVPIGLVRVRDVGRTQQKQTVATKRGTVAVDYYVGRPEHAGFPIFPA